MKSFYINKAISADFIAKLVDLRFRYYAAYDSSELQLIIKEESQIMNELIANIDKQIDESLK